MCRAAPAATDDWRRARHRGPRKDRDRSTTEIAPHHPQKWRLIRRRRRRLPNYESAPLRLPPPALLKVLHPGNVERLARILTRPKLPPPRLQHVFECRPGELLGQIASQVLGCF